MNQAVLKKGLLIAVIAMFFAAYFVFDLGQYLTLDYFKKYRAEFFEYYTMNPATVIVSYFAIYITATALAVPGALVLSLVGGALFGFWVGVVVISFASTIGASLAFLVSRYLLRDFVQSLFGDKLNRINRGVEKEGAFYLFTLRLIPVFPFFAVNTVMGLTPIRLRTYYWVSQVGMFPATLVFVNAGKQLGELDNLSGLISPELLISFALIGLLPLVAKKTLGYVRARRANG